jgi:CRP-like cAMP-binding protein
MPPASSGKNLWKELHTSIEADRWEEAVQIAEMIVREIYPQGDLPELFVHILDTGTFKIFKDVELVRYPRGCVIVSEGDTDDSMYVIVSGRVSVSAKSPETGGPIIPLPLCLINHMVAAALHGQNISLSELAEGGIFGETALIASRPRTATVTAVQDTELLRITKNTVERALEKQPHLYKHLYELYTERLDRSLETMRKDAAAPRGVLAEVFNAVCRAENTQSSENSRDANDLAAADPENPFHHLKQAESLFAAGFKDRALESYHKAGAILLKKGQKGKALVVYRIINSYDKDDAVASGVIQKMSEDSKNGAGTRPMKGKKPADFWEPFSLLGPDELQKVLARATLRLFQDTEVVVFEGDPGDAIFIIKSGTASAHSHAFGDDIELGTMDEGDVFGEIAFLTGKPRTATVTARGPLEVYEFTREAIIGIIDAHPEVMASFERTYKERIRHMMDRIEEVKRALLA